MIRRKSPVGLRTCCTQCGRRRSTEVSQTLHDVWPYPAMVHYIYTFGGSCPVREFCQVQSSLCVQVLRSPILAALLHSTRVVGVSQTCRVVQGMELRNFRSSSFSTEGAVYIPRAAITLGVGPHSSLFFLSCCIKLRISGTILVQCCYIITLFYSLSKCCLLQAVQSRSPISRY